MKQIKNYIIPVIISILFIAISVFATNYITENGITSPNGNFTNINVGNGNLTLSPNGLFDSQGNLLSVRSATTVICQGSDTSADNRKDCDVIVKSTDTPIQTFNKLNYVLNKSYNTNTDSVYIKCGNYTISSTLKTASNLKIFGANKNCVNIIGNGFELPTDHIGNVLIKDITLDVNGTAGISGFYVSTNSSNIFIEDTNILNSPVYPIWLAGWNSHVYINRNYFNSSYSGNGGHISIGGCYYDVNIDHNIFGGWAGNGNTVEVTDGSGLNSSGTCNSVLKFTNNQEIGQGQKAGYFNGRNIEISGNTFIHSFQLSSGSHSATNIMISNDFKVHDNTFKHDPFVDQEFILEIITGQVSQNPPSISNIKIYDNTWESGFIRFKVYANGSAPYETPVYKDIKIYDNTFNKSTSFMIGISSGDAKLNINISQLEIYGNTFNDWANSGGYGAIHFGFLYNNTSQDYSNVFIHDNTFLENQKAFYIQNQSGTTGTSVTGSIYFYNNILPTANYQDDWNITHLGNNLINGLWQLNGNLSWNSLSGYPVACPSGTFISQLGTAVICSTLDVYNKSSSLKDNLILDIPFDSSNNHIKDYINNNLGINNNAIWNESGGFNGFGYFKFNGINTSINYKETSTLNFSSSNNYSITLTAWINSNGQPFILDGHPISKYLSDANSFEITTTTNNHINCGSYINSADSYSDTYYTGWHFIVCKRDSIGNTTLYIDNVYKASTLTNNFVGAYGNNITIGKRGTEFSNYSIDNVKIWNRALSISEMTALYNLREKEQVIQTDSKDLNPITTVIYNLGSSILRWLNGYFVNLDVSGNVTLETSHYIKYNGSCIVAVGTGQTGNCI